MEQIQYLLISEEILLNMDENLIEPLITKKTKAIIPVHYAGVSCEMDTIIEIAKENLS